MPSKTYLRALESTDLEFLYELENDESVWQVSDTSAPFSKFVLQQYLENATADIYTTRQFRFVICEKETDKPVGAIDLYEFEPRHSRAGIGVLVKQQERGKGFAAEALQHLEEYCKNHLHLHQLFCTVPAHNEPSLKLFRQAGYSEIGVRKDWMKAPQGWQDVVEFQKLLTA
ncbi:MAG: GNAT family N-acetyltransferase [Hymenobacteraceae bacterium]|nr:GNAT family N-acetyltransferase [Hymenobacteraceae bacterium]MDX5397197.1 GNAT family N-acetyltransferase [Hymenobacteraceae bacterium]MDX5443387.1 GNAT family N-acetyltransferase [Hymenobacteraceae bacterium]MDX5513273.1 GNAT family N-acetyltransferase [Hymenobacteraceae bacterium]